MLTKNENKKNDLGRLLIMLLAWLICVNLFALLSLNRLNLKSDDAYKWIPVERYTQQQTWNIINIHSRWDSNWYLSIAKNGYLRSADDTASNVIFFPLYPFLLKVASSLAFGNLILAGWMISVFFLVLAVVMLFKLVKEFHKEAVPYFSVLLLLVFPTAFFLNAVYTESLFFFLSIGAFYYTKRGEYGKAGMLGFFASLTRVTGILLFIPLLAQFLKNEKHKKQTAAKAIPLLAIPLGTISFFVYHWHQFGDFLLFLKVQSAWGRSFSINWEHFLLETRSATSNLSLDLFYLIFILSIIYVLIKKGQIVYLLYVASTVLVALSTGTLMSLGRYILVLFPIFILGGSIKNEFGKYAWLLISTLLFAFNTLLFVNWYWAG